MTHKEQQIIISNISITTILMILTLSNTISHTLATISRNYTKHMRFLFSKGTLHPRANHLKTEGFFFSHEVLLFMVQQI